MNFLPKKLSLSSQKYGFGIRDPRSGIRKKLFQIPDPGVKKGPDPGSGSATLQAILEAMLRILDPVICFLIQVSGSGPLTFQIRIYYVQIRIRALVDLG
jgi:hypothetical protein